MTYVPANFPRKQLKVRAPVRRAPKQYMRTAFDDPPMADIDDKEATSFFEKLMSGAFEDPKEESYVPPVGVIDVEMAASGDVVMSSNTRREWDEL